jgi:hypothetical protein
MRRTGALKPFGLCVGFQQFSTTWQTEVLTPENHDALLGAARYKSRREVEQLVAKTRPKPDVPAVVRKLPSPRPRDAAETIGLGAGVLSSPSLSPQKETDRSVSEPLANSPVPRAAVVTPLAPERYKIQFTASREAHDKLRRAQSLFRHVIPNGDPAAVLERALDALLADLEKRKLALTERSRRTKKTDPGSRYIPAAVRREVWRRDGARCAFVGATGRCTERGFLELHHVVPFAVGGAASTANIELRCRAHNLYEAELALGTFILREQPVDYNSIRSNQVDARRNPTGI